MLDGKELGRQHWLIVKRGVGGMEVLTVDLGVGAEALPVFGFDEETRMFLDFRLGASEEGWRPRQTSAGELASVLYGPCSAVKKVALDPLPEVVDRGKSVGLPAMDRNDFLKVLLGEGPSGPRPMPSRVLGSYKGSGRSRLA